MMNEDILHLKNDMNNLHNELQLTQDKVTKLETELSQKNSHLAQATAMLAEAQNQNAILMGQALFGSKQLENSFTPNSIINIKTLDDDYHTIMSRYRDSRESLQKIQAKCDFIIGKSDYHKDKLFYESRAIRKEKIFNHVNQNYRNTRITNFRSDLDRHLFGSKKIKCGTYDHNFVPRHHAYFDDSNTSDSYQSYSDTSSESDSDSY